MRILAIIFLLAYVSASTATPRVTIICPVYDNDDCIEHLLLNLYAQSIFYDAEIIVFDNQSPGHEDRIIKKFMQSYAQIRYIRLPYKMNMGQILNRGIQYAHAPFITCAFVKDARTYLSLELEVAILEQQSSIDVVYADYCVSRVNDCDVIKEIENNRPIVPDIKTSLYIGPQPVWRKSLHARYGFFNETLDDMCLCHFWTNVIKNGDQFAKSSIISGVCFEPRDSLLRNESKQLIMLRQAQHERSEG